MADCTLYLGDARAVLPKLPARSFDACVCDPPYPMIRRPYGMLTEAEWFDLMYAVVPQVRRVLKPKGSAVFILQPNSRKVGSVRGWLWEFMAWVCREWNMVQDAYWWNHTAPPTVGCQRGQGLMRPSVKICVWCGPADCWRDQAAVLWTESERTAGDRSERRARLRYTSSGSHNNSARAARTAAERGGVTPFNLFPVGNGQGRDRHGAATPLPLCDWWVRYLVPPAGTVLDPFAGSGTVGVAALQRGHTFTGVEKMPAYVRIARKRLTELAGVP
jgi:DNA modification methylase